MTANFTEHELRESFCEVGRRVWQRQYIAANDGNFSARLNDAEILCTPTMVSKGFMKPDDMVVITPEGDHIRGRLRSTSEIRMHLEIYRNRPDVQSIVHVHPPHATAFTVVHQPIPKCVLPEIEVFIGEIPIAPYETPGTQAFADMLKPFLPNHNAFLLTNHGAVTVGRDPFEAYYRMETIDHYCRVLLLAAQLGGWNQIDPAKVRELFKTRENLGYKERRVGLTDAEICRTGVPGENLVPPATPMDGAIEEVIKKVIERLGQRKQ